VAWLRRVRSLLHVILMSLNFLDVTLMSLNFLNVILMSLNYPPECRELMSLNVTGGSTRRHAAALQKHPQPSPLRPIHHPLAPNP